MQSVVPYPEVETPALVIDMDIVDANIAQMAELARVNGVRLRPHTKTHRMPALAMRQLAGGAIGITCSSLGDAELMAEMGCSDIHVVIPIWGDEKIGRLRKLRERARVIVSLDSVEITEGVARLGRATRSPIEVFVNVDTGDHRVGLPPGRPTADLVRRIAMIPGIEVLGLFTHAGHAWACRSQDELNEVARREVGDLVETADLCARGGITIREISPGTTPTVRTVVGMKGISEIRPGTYIFNDTTMMRLGVATERTVAARVVSTVISRPSQERVVVDAGSRVLTAYAVGEPGWIVAVGWPDLTFDTLAIDVGVARFASLERAGSLAIGDRLELLPSCSVVDLFETGYLVRGGKVTGTVEIAGRGKVT